MSQSVNDVRSRLWSKVDKQGEDECWEFTGAINNSGYGSLLFIDSVRHAHRIAYCVSNDCLNDIDDIKVVRHSCDNRSCCNPAHLLPGDRKLNAEDMAERERVAGQKLSISDVREIRERYAAEDVTQKELSQDYECSAANICYIVNEESFEFVK